MAALPVAHGIKRQASVFNELNKKQKRTAYVDPKRTSIIKSVGEGTTGSVYHVKQEMAIKVVRSESEASSEIYTSFAKLLGFICR